MDAEESFIISSGGKKNDELLWYPIQTLNVTGGGASQWLLPCSVFGTSCPFLYCREGPLSSEKSGKNPEFINSGVSQGVRKNMQSQFFVLGDPTKHIQPGVS